MIRGIIPFKCSECGKRFMAPDVELYATAFSEPQPCPKCGSMHTRPWSIWPTFIEDYHYRPIWKFVDERNKKNYGIINNN